YMTSQCLSYTRPADHPPLRSFPTRRSSDLALPQPDGALLGDVYICPAAARRWVKNGRSGKGEEGRVEEELVRLTVHGTLHVLGRSEEHTSELQSRFDLVCRLLLEKKNTICK